jgi:hypothetical protein
MRTDRLARGAGAVAFLLGILVPDCSRSESIWAHYWENRIEVSGRSAPEWIRRFDLNVSGDDRPEIFVSDSGLTFNHGEAHWSIYSWVGTEPCFLGDVSITEDFAHYSAEAQELISPVATAPGEFHFHRYFFADDAVRLVEDRVIENPSGDRAVHDSYWVRVAGRQVLVAKTPEFQAFDREERSAWVSWIDGQKRVPQVLLTTTLSSNVSGKLLACSAVRALASRDETVLEHYRRKLQYFAFEAAPEEYLRLDVDLNRDGRPELVLSDSRRIGGSGYGTWQVYSSEGQRICHAGDLLLARSEYLYDAEERTLLGILRILRGSQVAWEAAYWVEAGSVATQTRTEWRKGEFLESERRLLERARAFVPGPGGPPVRTARAEALLSVAPGQAEVWSGAAVVGGPGVISVTGTGRVAADGRYWTIPPCRDLLSAAPVGPAN